MRLGLRVDGDCYRANLDHAEEAVEEFWRIEKQKKDTLSGTDASVAKRVSYAIGAFEELFVRDALGGAFDGDVFSAGFADIAIHEISGDVEELR